MRVYSLLPVAVLLAATPLALRAQLPVPAQAQTATPSTVIPLDRVVAIVGDVPITQ